MALSDRNIVITPNKGKSADPSIAFSGANATVGPQTIYANVYPFSGGTISFEASSGQLFSISNSLSGTIFSVNDVSGMPSISVNSSGVILLAPYGGKVGIGTTSSAGLSSNIFSLYGTAMIHGNIDLTNPTGGTSGIYFNDGTYLSSATAYSSYGNPGTIQFAGSGNTFNGDSSTFVWDNSNKRLGIGVAAPTNTLTVNGSTPAWFNTTNGANIYELVVGNSATTTSTTIGYAAAASTPYGYITHTASAARNITFNASGFTGIGGVTLPKNTLDVGGAVVIGSTYAGNAVYTAPANSLGVQGRVGVGTSSALSTLDVRGGIGATAASNFGGGVSVASLTSNGAISGTTGTFTDNVSIGGNASTNVAVGYSRARLTVIGGQADTAQASAALITPGYIQGERADLALWSTFVNTTDNIPRRTADIVSGFNGGAWGNEYLSFNVGNLGVANDTARVTSEKMRILSNGNTGIGTTTPTQRLEVTGNLKIGNATVGSTGIFFSDGTYQRTAAQILTFVRQSFTAAASQTVFTVTGGYIVGALDVYQNGSKLNITGDVTASNGTSITLAIGATVGDIIEVVGLSGNLVNVANAVPVTGGTMIGPLNMSSGTRSTSSSTGAITVGSSGGIGVSGNVVIDDLLLVGTNSPSGKLAVSADRATTPFTQVWTGRNGASFENDTVLGWNGSATFFGNYQNFPLTFITNTTERMRIAANGNVAIGTTNTTNAELTIQAVAGATTAGEIYTGDGTQWTRVSSNWGAGAYNGLVQANDHGIIFSNGSIDTGGYVIAQWSTATRGIRIAPAGNLLVGTATPVTGALMSVAGTITQAGDQVLDVGGGQLITGGYRVTPFNLGNTSGASITPNPNNGNYQYASNNGAATINAPTSDCAIDILIINTTGAAGFTFSGYTVVAGSTGDTAPTTSTTADWIISIRRINGVSTYVIKVIAT